MVAFANQPLFQLGHVVATPGALILLHEADVDASNLIGRHQTGDYGDLSAGDKAANDVALQDGSRIFSSYVLPNGAKIWVITEAVSDAGVRESTTLLLPEEY